MNFQEKLIENTAEIRARATALASTALTTARSTAAAAAQRVGVLKGSLATLQVAGRELNKVARRHVTRFVKENSTLAMAAGKDMSALARSTYSQLSQPKATVGRKPRKTARKRSAKSA
jgi:hypothetical protein